MQSHFHKLLVSPHQEEEKKKKAYQRLSQLFDTVLGSVTHSHNATVSNAVSSKSQSPLH